MRPLTGHKGDVRSVAYTPDGRLVSGGGDKSVRVWDVAGGRCATTIKAANVIYAVAVSPDGRELVYAGRYVSPAAGENHIGIWNLEGDHADGSFRWPMDPDPWGRSVSHSIWSLAYPADGRYLVAACRRIGGGNIPDGGGGRYWDRTPPYDTFPLPGPDIYAVSFATTGHRLAVTRKQAVLFLEPSPAATGVSYRLTASWSPAVAFVPGRDLAVVACGSYLIFVNPVRQEKPVRVKAGVRVVSALAAAPDGNTVLAGGRPGTVEVYDVVTRTRTTIYDFGIGGLHALAFAPDGLTFAAAGDAGLVVADAPGG